MHILRFFWKLHSIRPYRPFRLTYNVTGMVCNFASPLGVVSQITYNNILVFVETSFNNY